MELDLLTVALVESFFPVRILFLSHYFPPEVNAPASRTYKNCMRWARAGHDVTVVTCVPNCPEGVPYAGYRNRLRPQIEVVGGVRVVRVWTYLAPNAGSVRRIVNHLSYMISAVLACTRLPRADVVLATSPQFFCGWAGVLVSRLIRAPLVLEIRDIWPESIRAVGAMRNRPLLRLLEMLERRMYRAAGHIVTVGDGYRDNILGKIGVDRRISVVTNGVDLEQFAPRRPDPELVRGWGLQGKFICSYVGTIGMAHGLEVVIRAAKILRAKGRHDIAFCLVGDGALRGRLEQQKDRAGLNGTVVFAGRQPKEKIPAILSSSDACLVHLKKCELFGTVIPSKIFEILAVGRPIIMGVEGQARRMVMESGAGVAMEPDSPESLVDAVEWLADHPQFVTQRSFAGRDYVARHFNRDVLAEQLLGLLCRIAGRSDSAGMEERTDEHSQVPLRKAA